MATAIIEHEKRSMWLINILSIVIPLVVAVLLSLPSKPDLGGWTKNLSHVIGGINTLTTIVLIFGLLFIKQNKIELHRKAMTSAFALGSLFLICYVTYHLTNPANKFSGEGIIRYIYLIILFSHIGLSLVVLPLVLRAMFFAVTKQFELHKRMVKYAYPIWLYVSASGVVVYALLYWIYPSQ